MSIVGFNCWDIFFAILALYFVVRGIFRGFVGEVVALAGFIAAFYFSFHYSKAFGAFIESAAGINPYAAQAVAGVVIWLSISMLAAVVRMILKSVIGAASLGGVDKLLGLFSGALKTFVAVFTIMTAGILLAPVADPTWMSDSDVLRYAGRMWPQFRSMLIGFGLVPEDTALPDGTLEEILRPYRNDRGRPDGYDYDYDYGGATNESAPGDSGVPSGDVASGV